MNEVSAMNLWEMPTQRQVPNHPLKMKNPESQRLLCFLLFYDEAAAAGGR